MVYIIFFGIVSILILWLVKSSNKKEWLENWECPDHYLDSLAADIPNLSANDRQQIKDALKDYFTLRQQEPKRFYSMPSHTADQVWHNFILDTSAYRDFCKKAFGRYLDHVPSKASDDKQKFASGLRNTLRDTSRINQQSQHRNTNSVLLPILPLTYSSSLPNLFTVDEQVRHPEGTAYQFDTMTAENSNGECLQEVHLTMQKIGSEEEQKLDTSICADEKLVADHIVLDVLNSKGESVRDTETEDQLLQADDFEDHDHFSDSSDSDFSGCGGGCGGGD